LASPTTRFRIVGDAVTVGFSLSVERRSLTWVCGAAGVTTAKRNAKTRKILFMDTQLQGFAAISAPGNGIEGALARETAGPSDWVND